MPEKYASVIESREPITDQSFSSFGADEVGQLIQAGFLIMAHSNGAPAGPTSSSAKPGEASAMALHSIAAGSARSLAAATSGASGLLGARSSQGSTSSPSAFLEAEPGLTTPPSEPLQPTVPRLGPFLRLVEEARRHLLALLSRSKYGEAPVYLLRDRWDGGVSTRQSYGLSKDPFAPAPPGRTRKWKDLYGVNFDWVLAECAGGLVEVFDTGTVGLGVRKL